LRYLLGFGGKWVDRIRIAVVGCGFWGRNHLRVFSELPSAELVAAVDIDPERARFAEEKYGAKGYTDLEEMLGKERVDAVTICTPSITHAEVALKVIRAGKHVLVEKPMTSTTEEAVKLIEEAERQQIFLMVGHIERFNPAVERVKRFIDEGGIGEVVLISCRRVSRWPIRIGDVGVVKDLAIHDIDISRYITGRNPVEVYAVAGRIHHRYEDYANIILRFGERPTAFIEANWLTPFKVRKLTVTGSDGMITMDYISQEVTVANSSGKRELDVVHEEPLKRELSHFVDVVAGRAEPLINGRDGLMAVYIAEEALRSASIGKPIKLKPPINL